MELSLLFHYFVFGFYSFLYFVIVLVILLLWWRACIYRIETIECLGRGNHSTDRFGMFALIITTRSNSSNNVVVSTTAIITTIIVIVTNEKRGCLLLLLLLLTVCILVWSEYRVDYSSQEEEKLSLEMVM